MNAQLTRLRAEHHIAEPQRETHAAAVRNSRLHRSELAVPGSNVRMLENAPALGADVVMLDLEDAVAPDDKEQARINVIEALNDLDWSRRSVSLRINGLDTHYCYRDIVEVVEEAGQHLDTIMIPKAKLRGRHPVRGDAAHADRGCDSAEASDRDRGPHRDGDGHGELRGDRPRLS